MGVNCKLLFAPGVRAENVAEVCGALLGNKSYHEPIHGSTATFAKVDGISVTPTRVLCMVDIVIKLDTRNPVAKLIIDSDGDRYLLSYHYEAGPNGETLIGPKCTAAKIALCVALVEFFGGTLDINDCDAIDADITVPRRPDIHVSNDPEWSAFQQRILAVKPLTLDDVRKYEMRAAYHQLIPKPKQPRTRATKKTTKSKTKAGATLALNHRGRKFRNESEA